MRIAERCGEIAHLAGGALLGADGKAASSGLLPLARALCINGEGLPRSGFNVVPTFSL